jgi:hypothetical protein
MGNRWRTASGWSVEVVHLTATPDRHDGEWIRVAYFGWHVADVRDVAELERWFPLGDLEPDTLAAGACPSRQAIYHLGMARSPRTRYVPVSAA